MHFFVHIPKTAGTSFRTAAERYFGAERVVYDYGADSPVTSECVRRFLYEIENEDKSGLYRHWQALNAALVAGHMSVPRFLDHVGLGKVMTFVREPLERTFSEYLHFSREQRYRGSFRDFYRSGQINRQYRMTGGIPLRALGFVGITERYDDSLRLLNAHFGWGIRKRRVNRARWRDPGPGSISAEDRADFYKRNAKDVALYQHACWYFEQRLRLHEQGQPFAHAALESCKDDKVKGWAFWAKPGPGPVIIELRRNGETVCEATADRPHRTLGRHVAPGNGQVAFAAKMSMQPGDEITVVVAGTGQPLCLQPVKV